MNKRRLHHTWTWFRRIKPWYFLALAIVSSITCVLALRANNQRMIELRQAVYTADKQQQDVQKPLKELQAYVTSHMNTNLNAGPNPVYPPVQLKYTYERLVKAHGDEAAKANAELYSAAQAHCEQLNPTDFSGRNRVPCIEQYVNSHTSKTAAIPDALYKFAFATPVWSPDLAGWSMIAAIVSGLFFIASFIVNRWFRRNIS